MDLLNNSNIIIIDDNTNTNKESKEMNISLNLIGGKYTCEANKNKYDQICPIYQRLGLDSS